MILRYQHLSGMLGRWRCICQGTRCLHKSQAATNVFSKSQGSSAILGPKEMAATIFHLRKWIWNGTPEREKLGTISGSKLAAKSYPQAWSTLSMKCLHTLNSTQCWKSAAASHLKAPQGSANGKDLRASVHWDGLLKWQTKYMQHSIHNQM